MSSLRPFWIALQFLTRFPTPHIDSQHEEEWGFSLCFYPLVGLMLGSILYITNDILNIFLDLEQISVCAAIVVAVWILSTGALHLDGLADSADGWLGGLGDRERTLRIMRDPTSGPAGIVAIAMIILLKYSILTELLHHSPILIILPPLLARTLIPWLFFVTPYARDSGIGKALSEHFPLLPLTLITLITLSLLLIFTPTQLLVSAIAALITVGLLRQMMLRRIGGITGDLAGASIEMVETIILLTIVITL